MKKLMLLVAVLCALSVLAPQAQAKPVPGAKYDYKLKDVFPVAGRQGVTCDGKYIYVSCSKALYKYEPLRGLCHSLQPHWRHRCLQR